MPVAEANMAALTERLIAPLLGVIAYGRAPDRHNVATLIDLSALN
jgi:hypothetical protein